LLAKIVNDDAGILNERGALEFFASKLAPTVVSTFNQGLLCRVVFPPSYPASG